MIASMADVRFSATHEPASGLRDRSDMLRALVTRLLRPLQQADHLPLQCSIDAPRIVLAALDSLAEADRCDLLDLLAQGDRATSALNRTLIGGLRGDPLACDSNGCAECPEQASRSADDRVHGVWRTSEWLDRLYSAVRPIDPEAFRIICMRLDGFMDREISESLDLGLRLVKCLIREISSALVAGRD